MLIYNLQSEKVLFFLYIFLLLNIIIFIFRYWFYINKCLLNYFKLFLSIK
uniref:Uncharacterized protein n=1 Tax=Cyanophora biloba TaxID=1489483 RepID=A0A2Z4HGG1_9EUKA|nr:hypothetical protein [Cyanophora biloba]AWW13880.1 hypothetical protein [Cyanophora biloba]